MLTARDAFQVRELLHRHGIEARIIGRHYGRNPMCKVLGLAWRSLQLLPTAVARRPQLAISHGARSQLLVCNLLRIRSVLIDDYEHSVYPPLTRPDWAIVPEAIPLASLPYSPRRVLRYPGTKEDVYIGEFVPASHIRMELGLQDDDLVAAVRPPATEAHYHDRESEVLLDAVMCQLLETPEVRVLLLPRNVRQAAELRRTRPAWFSGDRIVVPARAVDGLNLLWNSDLVISAGGTMNREAAGLGVPVYSIFRGPTAAVDRQLELEGRLVLLRSPADIRDKLVVRRRVKPVSFVAPRSSARAQIIEHIEQILSLQCRFVPLTSSLSNARNGRAGRSARSYVL